MRSVAAMFVKEQQHRLSMWQGILDAASPERILSLGYSITRVNGKAVRSIDDVAPGDEITTVVAGGELISTVKEKNRR